MKEFDVFVENKPGELARLTEALARTAINIRGLATEKHGPRPVVKLITDDELSTRVTLERGGFEFEEFEALVLELIDRPGEIAKVARRAAKAALNIDSVFLLGRPQAASMALVTDNPKKAKEVFGP